MDALDEIYKIYNLLQRPAVNISEKIVQLFEFFCNLIYKKIEKMQF